MLHYILSHLLANLQILVYHVEHIQIYQKIRMVIQVYGHLVFLQLLLILMQQFHQSMHHNVFVNVLFYQKVFHHICHKLFHLTCNVSQLILILVLYPLIFDKFCNLHLSERIPSSNHLHLLLIHQFYLTLLVLLILLQVSILYVLNIVLFHSSLFYYLQYHEFPIPVRKHHSGNLLM